MNEKVQNEAMKSWTVDAQVRMVKCLIEDNTFAKQALPIINQNSFQGSGKISTGVIINGEYLRLIVTILKEKVQKYAVSYQILRDEGHTRTAGKADRQEELKAVINEIEALPMTKADYEHYKGHLKEFVAGQERVKVTKQLQEMVLKGCGAEFEELMKEHIRRTSFNDRITETFNADDLDELLADLPFEIIPTASTVIDKALNGGIRKGDYVIWATGTGVGKTSTSVSMACSAALAGYNVLHFNLEDKPEDIRRKMLSYVLGMNSYDISRNRQDARIKAEQMQGTLAEMWSHYRICSSVSKSTGTDNARFASSRHFTIDDIEQELVYNIDGGFRPDFIIIDYYDRIKSNIKNVWESDEFISDSLNNIASGYNVAIFVPSQLTKFQNTDPQLSDIAGGKTRTQYAQIIISMWQETVDKEHNSDVYCFRVLKNRYHKDYAVHRISFNNGTCRFGECEEEIDIDKLDDEYYENQDKAIKAALSHSKS